MFDYACDPEQGYAIINPVPSNNKGYIKRCKPSRNHPEDKAFQPKDLEKIRTALQKRIDGLRYDVNGYAILFASYTGVREGEIPAIQWSDVDFSKHRIHIHAQQNITEDSNAVEVITSLYVTKSKSERTIFYYNSSTKNEKGESKDGRMIPLTCDVETILRELQRKQSVLGINSRWVFCNRHGDWINVKSYYSSLYRLTKDILELGRTNNHAFRIAYNSYVLIPAGIEVTERAKILGHSVDTNLRYYSFSKSDEYIQEITEKLEAFTNPKPDNPDPCTPWDPASKPFQTKRKSPETANS